MAKSCLDIEILVKDYKGTRQKSDDSQYMLYEAASAIIMCRNMEDDYGINVERVGGTDIYDLYEIRLCGDLYFQDELITQTNYRTFRRWLDINNFIELDTYCDCFNISETKDSNVE